MLIAAPHITQEKYWKACCLRNKRLANTLKLEDHGFSYKIAYLERYIERLIENTENYRDNASKIVRAAQLLSPWVFTLEVRINSTELNIQEICQHLYNLISLKVRCA